MMEGEETFGSIIEKYYDNSLENMGDKDSFIWYGMFGINDLTYIKNLFDRDFKQVPDGRWACIASAPLQGFKSWITKGGIRYPCTVRYPQFKQSGQTIAHTFSTVMDVLPTFLDLAWSLSWNVFSRS